MAHRRSPSRTPSPDPKRRKQSHTSYNRSPSPTRYPRHQGRRDDRRESREYSRYDDRSSRDSYRDRDRDRGSGSSRRDRYDDRDSSNRPRDNHSRRSRSRSPAPPPSAAVPASTPATATPAPTSTPTPSAASSSIDDEKKKAKLARLEAWKKEQGAKKALSEAKAKAAALAAAKSGGAAATATPLVTPPSVPPKPTVQLNRAALAGLGLKGLPLKPDATKASTKSVAPSMDDFAESGRKLVKLSDMPPVDLALTEGGSVGENLEVDEEEETGEGDVEMKPADEEDDDEIDPLDAFMTDVTQEVKKVNAEDRKKLGGTSRLPIDGAQDEEGVEVPEPPTPDELDTTDMRPEDILALAAKKVKKKELAVVDHARVKYESFRKEFYRPAPEVEEMDQEDVDLLRLALDGIKIRGLDCPKPVTKWSHCGLPSASLDVIKRLNYAAPTAIQAQAIPAIMSGRDVIGVAKTGSGKTIAFLLPLFRHIKDQRPLENMEGPMAIVMTPTRELAVQIHRECKPFLKALNLRAVAAYGGSPIKDQIAEMKKGTEIIVCTPGRMIDLLTANSGRVTNLRRVTYLVLDEADRMFDMGFEPQVMKIVNNIRPDRQTVLFSATFPKQMDSLARKILTKPLEITVGGRSVVAPEIEQIVEVREEDTKFNRLLEILGQTYYEDKDSRTLIFVDRQEAADNLLRDLMRKGYLCMSLHGGKDQVDRDSTIADFKSGVVPIVTATSVAARGLDVKQLKLVINYDAPNHMEDYVHRAGRTGRAGNKGTCVTFITPEQERYSVDIWRALQASSAPVPPELETMATGFLEKVKAGKARTFEGSGFGGKGLERLDQERDAKEKAQRSAYGEPVEEKSEAVEKGDGEGELPFEFKVEIKRGPAPDSSKLDVMPGLPITSTSTSTSSSEKAKEDERRAASSLRAAEEAALKAGKDTAAFKQAQSVIAKLNAQVRATRMALANQSLGGSDEAGRKGKDPDATDFHAIVPINDYPQKARWRVTNKETMVQLIDMTGASVTNKGIYYESGKEPAPGAPPKLHLLIESNEEYRVEQAVREIKRLLIEASTAALQAEARNPTATGRYSVV